MAETRQPAEPEAAEHPDLACLGRVIERFGLASLRPAYEAARVLDRPGAPIDIAVLGQFKAGKSSLLNAIAGADLLPVGVLPVTAVVTRIMGGDALAATATTVRGDTRPIPVAGIAAYVSESGNPGNARGVRCVDVRTPTLADLGGLRLVDTPGLGSVHTHNTRATLDWLPSVAAAVVAISVERPFSEEDRRLVRELRPLASRVIVVLTKTDLLTGAELEQVTGFVAAELRRELGVNDDRGPVIIPFSVRNDGPGHARAFRERVLAPLARDAGAERASAVAHKVRHLAAAARSHLQIALCAAERVGRDRAALLAAVVDESVQEPTMKREISLAAASVVDPARGAFEAALRPHLDGVAARVTEALGEMKHWRGHLGKQSERFRAFLGERLAEELARLEPHIAPVAERTAREAESRIGRIAGAFRDRLARNVTRELGVTLSTPAWEPARVAVVAPEVVVGETFMTHWDLFWWLLPMPLVGGLFRRHCRGKVPWAVWINGQRLASGWFTATGEAVSRTRAAAEAWVHTELATIRETLARPESDIAAIRAALADFDAVLGAESMEQT